MPASHPGQKAPKPGRTQAKVTSHGRQADIECGGDFLVGHSPEVAQLDDLCLPLIDFGQLIYGLAEFQNIGSAVGAKYVDVF